MSFVLDEARIVSLLEEFKAFDINVYNVEAAEFNTVFVCTAHSALHSQSIVSKIRKFLKAATRQNIIVDGFDVGNWISIACDKMILHVFLVEFREYYEIDSWMRTYSSKKN